MGSVSERLSLPRPARSSLTSKMWPRQSTAASRIAVFGRPRPRRRLRCRRQTTIGRRPTAWMFGRRGLPPCPLRSNLRTRTESCCKNAGRTCGHEVRGHKMVASCIHVNGITECRERRPGFRRICKGCGPCKCREPPRGIVSKGLVSAMWSFVQDLKKSGQQTTPVFLAAST